MVFQEGGRIRLSVESPLHQEVLADSTQLLLYYPDENRAVRIQSPTAGIIPFCRVFFAATLPDFALASEGCTLTNYESNEDTLKTQWRGGVGTPLDGYIFFLFFSGTKLLRCDQYNGTHVLIRRIEFSDHIDYGDWSFPTRTTYYDPRSGAVIEDIRLFSVACNPHLDGKALSLELPRNVEITDIEW